VAITPLKSDRATDKVVILLDRGEKRSAQKLISFYKSKFAFHEISLIHMCARDVISQINKVVNANTFTLHSYVILCSGGIVCEYPATTIFFEKHLQSQKERERAPLTYAIAASHRQCMNRLLPMLSVGTYIEVSLRNNGWRFNSIMGSGEIFLDYMHFTIAKSQPFCGILTFEEIFSKLLGNLFQIDKEPELWFFIPSQDQCEIQFQKMKEKYLPLLTHLLSKHILAQNKTG
jgi:hypothetical protein